MFNQIIWKSSCPLDVSTRRELLTRTSFNRACINASVAKAGLCRRCKANRKDILKFSLICRRVKFQEPSNGFALVGHVFANITLIIGPHMNNHCKNRCIMEQRCRSINIGQARVRVRSCVSWVTLINENIRNIWNLWITFYTWVSR